MQINIPLDPNSLARAIDGNKTYISLAIAAAVIAANHFGLLPPEYTPQGLDPNNWVRDEFMLLLGATGRSALKKLEPGKVDVVGGPVIVAPPADPVKPVDVAKALQTIADNINRRPVDEAGRQAPLG